MTQTITVIFLVILSILLIVGVYAGIKYMDVIEKNVDLEAEKARMEAESAAKDSTVEELLDRIRDLNLTIRDFWRK